MLTICCVKSRPYYTRHDVHKLWAMIERNITIPHRFVCFTDDADGMRCKTKAIPSGLEGWWAKLSLFRHGLMDGKILYIDLDTLITGNLDFIDDYKGDFAILRDFYRPDGYGSGVMLWNKPQPQVWDMWSKHKPYHPLGDQGVMEDLVPGADRLQDLWPGKFVSYKVDCEAGIPSNAAVVCFHGHPKPDNFSQDHWVQRIWNGQMEMAA